MEKAKYGKMRQVNAVNGSQMVVKIGVFYYRLLTKVFMIGFSHSSSIYSVLCTASSGLRNSKNGVVKKSRA